MIVHSFIFSVVCYIKNSQFGISNGILKPLTLPAKIFYHQRHIGAGGNGTAGTAMAIPVFEGEKWRRLDSNLACVIEYPLRALRRSLGRLRGL